MQVKGSITKAYFISPIDYLRCLFEKNSRPDKQDGSFLQNIILIFFEKLRIIIHCLIKIFNGICFTEIVFVCIPLLSLHKVYLHGQCVKAPSHKDICRILLHLKNSWNQKLWRFPELFL